MNINNIWDWIRDSLSWEKIDNRYPEGRGIYNVFEIDLATARTDQKYTFYGDRLIVQQIDSDASLKLNNPDNDSIDLNIIRWIKTPFREFYITNEAKTGFLKILAGTEGMFEAMQEIRQPSDAFGHLFDISNDELAVRLGALSTYDRRGDLIWMDGFEGAVLRWNKNGVGAGGSAALSTSAAVYGDGSCKLVTGAVAGNEYYINRKLPYPTNTRIGAETSVTLTTLDGLFDFRLEIRDDTTIYRGVIRYKKSNEKWYYLNSSNNYVEFADDLLMGDQTYNFTMIKLVIDYDTKKYVRAILDSFEYDLSAHSLRSQALGGRHGVNVTNRIEAESGNAVTAYVDNVIVTQNEP